MTTPEERRAMAQRRIELQKKAKERIARQNKAKQANKSKLIRENMKQNLVKQYGEDDKSYIILMDKRAKAGQLYERAFNKAFDIITNPHKTLEKMHPTMRHAFFKLYQEGDRSDEVLEAVTSEANIDNEELILVAECEEILEIISGDVLYEQQEHIQNWIDSVQLATLGYEGTIEKQKADGRLVESIEPNRNDTRPGNQFGWIVNMVKVIDYYGQKVYNNSQRDERFYRDRSAGLKLPPLDDLIKEFIRKNPKLLSDTCTTEQVAMFEKKKEWDYKIDMALADAAKAIYNYTKGDVTNNEQLKAERDEALEILQNLEEEYNTLFPTGEDIQIMYEEFIKLK